MRVASLFKRLLRLGRGRVVGVELLGAEGAETVVVDLALPVRRAMFCSGCQRRVRVAYDRRTLSWRHLDLLRTRCLLRCEIRRVACPECGVRSERVPWARAGSRFTRAFEDTCVWLARSTPKVVVARLMRVDWATVGRMIERVVSEHAAAQPGDGLDGLRRIGIDEVAYRKGHRYLICVGRPRHGARGLGRPRTLGGRGGERSSPTLGPERCRALEAVSVDLHGGWLRVIRAHCPRARICADPFHVVKLAGDALDELRRADWQRLREEDPERARWLKGTRFLLRRRADTLRPGARSVLEELAQTNQGVYRGWLLVDQLRAVLSAPTRRGGAGSPGRLGLRRRHLGARALRALRHHPRAARRRGGQRGRARDHQRAPGGHELDRAAHEPPGPGLPPPSVPAGPDHAGVRPHPGGKLPT